MSHDSSTPVASSHTRPRLVWLNTQLAEVWLDGRRVGAIRQRLDGSWDSIVGAPHRTTRFAAETVVSACGERVPA